MPRQSLTGSGDVFLQTERPTARLQLVSTSPAWTAFHIGQASPDTAAEGAIPKWLDIFPASGYLPPQVCHPNLTKRMHWSCVDADSIPAVCSSVSDFVLGRPYVVVPVP